MKMRKKGIATVVLAVSAAGAAGFGWLASETGGFFVGLLFVSRTCKKRGAHGCLAATIGGLADWFAVTAIFRKPLGISYRTEILRRSRPRIMRSLAEFAGKDLLSRENIVNSISKQDFSEMLVEYLMERGGRERILALADAVFARGVETVDMGEIAAVFESSIRRMFLSIRLDEMAGSALNSTYTQATNDRFLQSLLSVVRKVWNDDELQAMMLSSIGNIREMYIGDQSMRAALFNMDELSDGRLLGQLNEYMESWIEEMENRQGDAYQNISEWMISFFREGEQRERLLATVRRWQIAQVEDADIRGRVQWSLEVLRENCLLDWRQKLRGYLEDKIDKFLRDEEAKARFNGWVLQWFDRILEAHHEELPQMMERQLAKLTDDELVELVETRVEDDLQMIRINGAVVGSFVGMLLYVLTLAAERMWA